MDFKHFKLSSFACDFVVLGDFVGAQRYVWVGLQEDEGGRFENLEREMQLPPK